MNTDVYISDLIKIRSIKLTHLDNVINSLIHIIIIQLDTQ